MSMRKIKSFMIKKKKLVPSMITCAHVCFLQCRIWAVLTGWLCLPCICGCWFSSPDHIKKNVSSFPSTLSSASVEQLPSLPSRCVTCILKRSIHMYTHTCTMRLTVFILLFAEMLPLPVPAISTGTLHCFLKLVGSKCSCGLCSVVPVSLCRPLQGCVTTVFFFSSWISKKKKRRKFI